MSLDKAIQHGKEKRQPYRHSKRFDKSCRNHGDCPWCERARQLSKLKLRVKVADEMKNDA